MSEWVGGWTRTVRLRFVPLDGVSGGVHQECIVRDWDMVYDTLYIELEYKSLKNGQKASRNDTPYSPA